MVLDWDQGLTAAVTMASSRVSRRTRRQKDAASSPLPLENGDPEEVDPRVKYQLPDLDLKSTLGELISRESKSVHSPVLII